MSKCIECYSRNTERFWGDDGHFRKECLDCGYIGGPYVSNQIDKGDDGEDEEDDENGAESIFDY